MSRSEQSVSLRVSVPLQMFERISEYRHLARHDSKNQALVALISAGLAAMTKPVTLPAPVQRDLTRSGSKSDPKRVAYAGAENDRASRQW
jgi:hypothetical protein